MRLQTKVKRSQELEYKTHLTPKELAELLGVSKATVYRFISEGRIKTLQLPGKTLIRRSDVNELFNADMMNVSAYSTGKVNHTLYYTLNEVCQMYKLSRYGLFEKIKEYGIPTERHFSRIYFRKDLVDEKFEELRRPIDLSLYYTLDEAVSLFNLSNQTIYPIMREHNVKHIVYKKKTYFLKETLDKLHKEHEVLCSFKDYYSLNEVTAKFKIGKFAANSLCKAEGIEPMKCGIYLLFPKKPFEEAFARRQERLNHLQAEKDEQQKAAEEKQIQQQKAAVKKQKKLVPEGFYSTEEITLSRKINTDTLLKRVKKLNIEFICMGNIRFYNKEQVDRLMPIDATYSQITDWVTGKDIPDILGITSKHSIYDFIRRYKIPKKMELGVVYYSRQHLLDAKNEAYIDKDVYYTYPELMEKYHLKRDQVRYHIKVNHIQSVQFGRLAYIPRKPFDDAMQRVFLIKVRQPDCKFLTVVSGKQDDSVLEEVPEGYYSLTQVADDHSIAKSTAHKILKENRVRSFNYNRQRYYLKEEVDLLFNGDERCKDIKEWISVKDALRTYHISAYLCAKFVKEHNIPRRIEKFESLYSKEHFEKALEQSAKELEAYYLIEELTEKLELPRARLYALIDDLKLKKLKRGKRIYILMSDLPVLKEAVREYFQKKDKKEG